MTTKLKNVIAKIHNGVYNNGSLNSVINRGGCGVFAYYFIKQCEKYNIKGISLTYLDFEYEVIPPETRVYNITNCKNNWGLNISAQHIMVTINNKFLVDAGYIGTKKPNNYSHLKKTNIVVPAKLIGRTLKIRAQWNSWYEPEEYNPVIRRIINQAFKKEYGALVTK